jgi:hypothetical protein
MLIFLRTSQILKTGVNKFKMNFTLSKSFSAVAEMKVKKPAVSVEKAENNKTKKSLLLSWIPEIIKIQSEKKL